ncbi:MAG: hypothetical protein J6Z13_07170 [Clostridia bacterium]|nr:hypothetical protein [Clostridia bacterium]
MIRTRLLSVLSVLLLFGLSLISCQVTRSDGHDRIADGDPRLLLTEPTAGWYLSPDGSAILYRPKTEPERLMSQTMP